MEEWGARLVLGEGNTFKRTRGGAMVASRINFAVEGGGAHLGPLVTEWGLSNHSAISGIVQIGALEGVVATQETVD